MSSFSLFSCISFSSAASCSFVILSRSHIVHLFLIEGDPVERERLLTALRDAAPGCTWTAAASLDEIAQQTFEALVVGKQTAQFLAMNLPEYRAIGEQRPESGGTMAASIARDLNNALTP